MTETIEELCLLAAKADNPDPEKFKDLYWKDYRAVVRAVLAKLEPVIAQAHADGAVRGIGTPSDADYARRIRAQIEGD